MEIFFILALLATGLVVSGAAQARMASTPHDLGGGICEYCHTPAKTSPPESPLWNLRDPAKASFTTYDSPTIPDWAEGEPRGISLVCLACHDGVISHNTLLENPGSASVWNLTGNPAAVGRHGPSNLHPISITYNRTRSVDFKAVKARKVGNLPLYRSSVSQAVFDHVECASCHNPHDMTNGHYLRMGNDSSALCLTCHVK